LQDISDIMRGALDDFRGAVGFSSGSEDEDDDDSDDWGSESAA
jgi:hypothetical protein